MSFTPEQEERFLRNFENMKPHLPEGVSAFLDIGSGLGGIAGHVAKHYPEAVAHLMDGAKAEASWTSYRPGGKPWACVFAAAQHVRRFSGSKVEAHVADPDETIPCELIYSTVSWGHHYPIEVYLGLARRSLKPGGTLIVDLRLGEVGEHGREVLARHFKQAWADIHIGKKYARTVWRNA